VVVALVYDATLSFCLRIANSLTGVGTPEPCSKQDALAGSRRQSYPLIEAGDGDAALCFTLWRRNGGDSGDDFRHLRSPWRRLVHPLQINKINKTIRESVFKMLRARQFAWIVTFYQSNERGTPDAELFVGLLRKSFSFFQNQSLNVAIFLGFQNAKASSIMHGFRHLTLT
jgi:hypothetical protein